MIDTNAMIDVCNLVNKYGIEKVNSLMDIINGQQECKKSKTIDEIMSVKNDEKEKTRNERNALIVQRFDELTKEGKLKIETYDIIAKEVGVCQKTVINVISSQRPPKQEVIQEDTAL